ncbi:6016_t:CDS:2 [Funneliformis caledonium]|uniref:6016_t:CDS:1 n=1 Tax=Funneliformis caledonium TaxID=1117310 RepID=A0A9N8VF56_9GLOM|nr:6016_t:CDS:2 [Funneliformis caledonium]
MLVFRGIAPSYIPIEEELLQLDANIYQSGMIKNLNRQYYSPNHTEVLPAWGKTTTLVVVG